MPGSRAWPPHNGGGGQVQGRGPKLKPVQEREIVRLYRADYDTVREIGALFNVSRPTVYRAVRRADY